MSAGSSPAPAPTRRLKRWHVVIVAMVLVLAAAGVYSSKRSRSSSPGSVWNSVTTLHGISGRDESTNSARASHVNSLSGSFGAVRASSQPLNCNAGLVPAPSQVNSGGIVAPC